MSEDLKNIDIIYRKELRDYSQSAPDDVWSNIEQGLNQSKKKSYISFYKVAAAIISFTLIGSIYLYLNNNDSLENLPIAENQSSNEIITKPEEKEQVALDAKEEKVLTEEKIETKVLNSELFIAESRTEVKAKNQEDKDAIKINATRELKELSKIEPYLILMVFESPERKIIDNRQEQVKSLINTIPDFNSVLALDNFSDKPIQKEERWAFGGEFSPLYSYRHITETIRESDKELYNSVENPVMSYSGGLNFQYKAFGRLTVQVGVYYSTMGQALDYMAVYENSAFSLVPEEFQDRYINAINLENSIGGITFNTEYVFIDERAERVSNLTNSKSKVDVSNPVFNNLDAEIEQSFQYIEVPFLIRYKFIDKLIDVNFVGGVGANFLIGNDVYIAYGDYKESIGHTNGVRDINYNGTIGLGFEYPILKRINFRFEPSIKYYLNEINPTSQVESHPYSLGFYTGINYSF
ncbi:MAG: outer membrane beta-barrel protein [Bacteroidales bacterium]|nr:outer membrane beta-barrel protein [Bacteroidales bacterium]